MFGFRFLNLKVITLFLSLLMLGAGGVLFISSWRVSQNGINTAEQSSKNLNDLIDNKFSLLSNLSSLQMHVVQVQQFLQDISATRGQDGLDDGFAVAEVHAKAFNKEIEVVLKQAEILNLDELVDSLKIAKKQFVTYYTKGQEMAHSYVNGGPASGNKMMEEFDAASTEINDAMNRNIGIVSELIEKNKKGSYR